MLRENSTELKERVKAHWEDETCGTRYADAFDRSAYFDEISVARYAIEPYIAPFADFSSARGKRPSSFARSYLAGAPERLCMSRSS